MKLTKETLLRYYSNKELQELLWEFGKNREVSFRDLEGRYFKRPSMLLYPSDVLAQVKKGAVSFHCSVERWANPLLINERNYDEQRIGFDWVVDIDSNLGIEEAKIAAELVMKFLDKQDLNYFVKFSGRRGFHFCVFWENFPREINYKETRLHYPELPKIMSIFLREQIKDELWDRLVEFKGSIKELTGGGAVEDKDPFKFVEVEKDWSNRHLFRMPYSLHEKTGLASVIIKPEYLKNFSLEDAKIDNIKITKIKLDGGNAERIIIDSCDFEARQKEKMAKKPEKEIKSYKGKITAENFPPCITKILLGIPDGRKRSTFTLITFLRSCNWSMKEVEEAVKEWGKKVGLHENYINSQISWHHKQKKNILPPNCDNGAFYKDMGICSKVPLCDKIKNPINFSYIKAGGEKKKRKIK